MFNNYSTFRDQCNCWDWDKKIDDWYIYHNPELWLISISFDKVNWITIADKNLWATEVWNKWDEVTQENNWFFYQRWNNYWFPMDESQYTRRARRVSARNYWPWNYYNSNWVLITTNYYWDSSANNNLWWWWDDTLKNFMWRDATNFEDRQWPCPDWFHIPSWWLLNKLYNTLLKIYNKLNCVNYISEPFRKIWFYRQADKYANNMYPEINDYIKLAPSWWLNMNMDWHYYLTYNWNLWSSSVSDETLSRWYYANKIVVWQRYYQFTNNHLRSNAFCIRPFKNEPVVPDDTWIKLY